MIIRLSGNSAAKSIYRTIQKDISLLKEKNIIPGLAVVQVGNNLDSTTYVNMKAKMCNKYGIYSRVIRLPETIDENHLIKILKIVNTNKKIHGILVQLPLPKSINEDNVLNSVNPNKDVDGFHCLNVGKLNTQPKILMPPCTPSGTLALLDHYNIDVAGKDVVVIGRSRIVGKPLSDMLLKRDASVTICHSKTKNPEKYTKQADIVFVACGIPKYLKSNMIKEGAIVIDIGINSGYDENTQKKVLVGDVDYEDVKEKIHAITPVPGGIGPMTIAMLLQNTIASAKNTPIA